MAADDARTQPAAVQAPPVQAPPPRPRPTPLTEPFWEALGQERLVVQRCRACGTWVHYPRVRCPGCLGEDLVWEDVEARGTIYAMTVARAPTAPPFAGETPQAIAVVELGQGTRITTTIVGDDEARLLAVGAPVRGVFEHGPDGTTLLRFTPEGSPERERGR